MRTSVIVVCHRPGPWLRRCLESVCAGDTEVILVDNASPGGAAGDVGQALGVRVLGLEKNLGFSGGVNAGLRLAKGDLVALLNDDAVATPGWLPSAAAVLGDPSVAAVAPKLVLAPTYVSVELPDAPPEHPGDDRLLGFQIFSATVNDQDVLDELVGGVYPVEHGDGPSPSRWRWTRSSDLVHLPLPPEVDPADVEIRINGEPVVPVRIGDVINNAGSYLSAEGHGGDFGHDTADDGRFDTPAERFGMTGAAMVARREVFEHVGGMAGDFFAYYEDLDWSWRARLLGYTIRYEPAGVVRHVRSATFGTDPPAFVRMLTRRNRLLCLVRNAPLGFARRQVMTEFARPDGVGMRASFARRAPAHLAYRARVRRSRKLDPWEVIEQWAGRDETWGLPSQIAEREADGRLTQAR